MSAEPRVWAYLITSKQHEGMVGTRLAAHYDPSRESKIHTYVPLVSLADYEALKQRYQALLEAKAKIPEVFHVGHAWTFQDALGNMTWPTREAAEGAAREQVQYIIKTYLK